MGEGARSSVLVELMSKVYVIGRVGWEYNDEVMYRAEGGGSLPTQAFRDKQKAENFCKQKNIEWIVENQLADYIYSMDELFEDENVLSGCHLLEGHGINSVSDMRGLRMSFELAEKLLPYLRVVGYEVTEVELY